MVRAYKNEDYDQILDWCIKRRIKVPLKKSLPFHGYIWDGVAVGFLYLTDSSLAIIDCYIANPASDKKIRDNALDAITLKLICLARDLQCKVVKADTQLESIKKRCKKFGFREVGEFTSFLKEV